MMAREATLAIITLLVLGAAADLSAEPAPTDHLIQFYRARVTRDPADFLNYNKLGAAYIQKARESGDLTYYDLAEQALTRSLTLVSDGPPAATATMWLAAVRFARHQFRDALALARRALALGPDDRISHAIAGDAYLELGEYDNAASEYAKMLTLRGPLHPYSRRAHLDFLKGNPAAAIEQMRRAVAVTGEAAIPAENTAWASAQLGELYLHVSDVGRAEEAYRDSLARQPRYHVALAGLAAVRATQKRYAEAVDLYRDALAAIPLPEYAAALGDVYTAMGQPREARKQYELVEFIGRLNALNKTVYNRELALFYADHDMKAKESLELAEKELEVRRDIYTYDVLAWVLHKNGKPQEALGAMRQALRLGTQHARLFFHAGMIHRALGEPERARDYLERALALNPRFHVLHAPVAAGVLAELKAGR